MQRSKTTGIRIALLGLVLVGRVAMAGDIPGYPDRIDEFDAREIALLPKYCKYAQTYREHIPGGNDPDKMAHWYQVMGPTFHAMHHYCNGLMDTNRALLLATSQRVRSFYLSASIGEFDYVIERAPADFIMLPEILTKKGENLLRLGRNALAVETLQRAMSLKADYWPPYAALSDYYKDAGNRARARELLERALAFAPDARGLKTRMAALDAKNAAR